MYCKAFAYYDHINLSRESTQDGVTNIIHVLFPPNEEMLQYLESNFGGLYDNIYCAIAVGEYYLYTTCFKGYKKKLTAGITEKHTCQQNCNVDYYKIFSKKILLPLLDFTLSRMGITKWTLQLISQDFLFVFIAICLILFIPI